MMTRTSTRTLALLTAMTVSSIGMFPAAFAQDTRSDVQGAMHNPIVKQTAVGAGIGAIAGFLTGHHRHEGHSVLRGAGIGALTGAGTGLISDSRTMQRHPLVKTTAQGAIIGTGASAVTHRSKAKGALIGGGVGAGWHFLDQYLHNDQRY